MLPHPASSQAPKFWRYETGGELVPAMERYIRGESLQLRDVSLIRAYLRQWVEAPVWEMNPLRTLESSIALGILRAKVAGASTKGHLDSCVQFAIELGMDPL
jgi:hypothetical protein